MELDWLNDNYKTVFSFYRDTGSRGLNHCSKIFTETGCWLVVKQPSNKWIRNYPWAYINPERIIEMRAFLVSYSDTLGSWIGNLSKTCLKAMREVDGQDTKYHLHCLSHTIAVRRYLHTSYIYFVKQELGHASVVITEICARFNLRWLESDFPWLVKSTKNAQNYQKVHTFGVHRNYDESLCAIISGFSAS